MSLLIAFSAIIFATGINAFAETNDGEILFSIYSMYGNDSSSGSIGGGVGHSWLVIENGTNYEYDFFNTIISAGETVSIGTWGNMKDPNTQKLHKGAWLNIEACMGWGTASTASLTMAITSQQLSDISDDCISMDDWTLINNCSYFASSIWNNIAPDEMDVVSYFFPANFPSTLKNSIMEKDAHEINRAFAYNDYTGYCTSANVFKYVEADTIINSLSSNAIINANYYTSFPMEYNSMAKIESILNDERIKYEK